LVAAERSEAAVGDTPYRHDSLERRLPIRPAPPSALYGVASRALGQDRIDESGINAGFYERATAAEICDYYSRVLEEHFLPSGRVRFFGSIGASST
jgi:hypothetical protein